MNSTKQSWRGMKERCDCDYHKNYARYGGRGIRYPLEWETLKGFIADMGLRPPGTELDRIDNDESYSKENCQWISHKDNARKSSKCKLTKEKARLIKGLLSAIKPGTPNTKVNVVLGDVFGISRHTIHAIRTGRIWN